MQQKWYNKEISNKFALIILIIVIIAFCFLPIHSIECSNNNCTIYSKSVFFRNPKFINWFKTSDIEHYEIRENIHNSDRGGIPFCNKMVTYSIELHMKSGEFILINDFHSQQRAQEIYNNMVSNDNFSLKGNFWNSLCNSY